MPDPSATGEPARVGGPSPDALRPALTVRTLVVAALVVIAVLGLVSVVRQVTDLLLLLLVAIVFAEGVRPLVTRLERVRLPRPAAIAVVYLGLILVTALLVTLLVQPIVTEAQALARNLPRYQAEVQSTVSQWQRQLNLGGSGSPNIAAILGGGFDTAKNVLLTIGGYIVGLIANLVLVLVIGFLWLVTAHRLELFVVDLMPLRHQALAADVLGEIGQRMGGFLRATALNMVVVGVLTGLVSLLFGLPNPVLLGIFAGLTAAIPLVGPFIGVVPPILLALTLGTGHALLVALVLVIVQLIDGNLVIPTIMNRAVSLPALAVVVSLLVGAALQGLIGALLAVPVASAIQVVVVRVLVPYIHVIQGRHDRGYAEAYAGGPTGGGRRDQPR